MILSAQFVLPSETMLIAPGFLAWIQIAPSVNQCKCFPKLIRPLTLIFGLLRLLDNEWKCKCICVEQCWHSVFEYGNAKRADSRKKLIVVACVVAHEIAHITQNHGEEKRKKQIELDQKTSVRVSLCFESVLRDLSVTYIAGMAILGGINAGLGNSTYSTDMAYEAFG